MSSTPNAAIAARAGNPVLILTIAASFLRPGFASPENGRWSLPEPYRQWIESSSVVAQSLSEIA
jgi:hypothetical protein